MIKKVRFYKELLIELIETLSTICLYLHYDARCSYVGRRVDRRFEYIFDDHFDKLKKCSEELQGLNKEKVDKKEFEIRSINFYE